MDHIIHQLGALQILPVVKLDRAEDADALADALHAGGLPCAEITLRTAAGLPAIERLAAHRSDLLVGAGTVLDLEQARNAVGAGARFVVSPGLDSEVVGYCQEQGVPVFPGVATPTDVMAARKLGLSIVKFFPAEALGGTKTLDALRGPFPDLRFIPTGGIGTSNAAEYLGRPAVFAIGGSFMVPSDAIRQHDTDRITALTEAAVRLRRTNP